MSFWIVSSPTNVIPVIATVRENMDMLNQHDSCKSKSIFWLAIFQKEDQFEITWLAQQYIFLCAWYIVSTIWPIEYGLACTARFTV